MYREFLNSKMHRATITESNLNYSGSITIDESLMEEAGILPHERVHVFNINNGERFETYVIKGKRGSGAIGLNGAAARKGTVGDLIIIVSYCYLTAEEMSLHKPKILLMGEGNKIIEKLDASKVS